ncbi:hypothetical protein SK128_022811 [Halocaridina rubra]|uniref:Uncharacterized protein n=1 Tax=Halocaridina rubra TaxID=373956 RepID=A0AAN9A8Z6_HALRR
MQYWAPENVFGLIKPNLGVSKCWFQGDLELFIYFYGPIAFLFICNSVLLVLTYIHYNSILHSYKEADKCLKELGTGITSVSSSPKSSMPARQLTNHVNE